MTVSTTIFSSVWAMALIGMIWSCSGSDFTGKSSKASAVRKPDPVLPQTSATVGGEHTKLGVPVNQTRDIPVDAGGGCRSENDSIARVVGNKVEGLQKGETVLDCNDRKVRVDVYDPSEGIPAGIDDGGTQGSTTPPTGGTGIGNSGGGTSAGTTGTGIGQSSTGAASGNSGLGQSDGSQATGNGGILGEDGGMSAQIWSDAVLTLNNDDDCSDGKVQFRVDSYLPNGQVAQSITAKCPNKVGQTIVLPRVCYNPGRTCLKVTIATAKTYDTWNAGELIDVRNMGKSTNFVFDNGISFIFGNPNADRGSDDEVTISCEASRTSSLSVVNCL